METVTILIPECLVKAGWKSIAAFPIEVHTLYGRSFHCLVTNKDQAKWLREIVKRNFNELQLRQTMRLAENNPHAPGAIPRRAPGTGSRRYANT